MVGNTPKIITLIIYIRVHRNPNSYQLVQDILSIHSRTILGD